MSAFDPKRTLSRRCSERARADIRRPGITAPKGINVADISPDLFMDAVLGYQQTAAIKAALELDLFSEIGKGNATAESLARTTGAAVRGVRILCDYLTVRGHLEKHGDNYRLTQSAAAFLD